MLHKIDCMYIHTVHVFSYGDDDDDDHDNAGYHDCGAHAFVCVAFKFLKIQPKFCVLCSW